MTNVSRRLAWVVLQTANRTQAKGSSVRLVVPRAPEVTYELEPPLSEAELLAVEGYLFRAGIEGRISVLRRSYGLGRCLEHGEEGMGRWGGRGIVVHSLARSSEAQAERAAS